MISGKQAGNGSGTACPPDLSQCSCPPTMRTHSTARALRHRSAGRSAFSRRIGPPNQWRSKNISRDTPSLRDGRAYKARHERRNHRQDTPTTLGVYAIRRDNTTKESFFLLFSISTPFFARRRPWIALRPPASRPDAAFSLRRRGSLCCGSLRIGPRPSWLQRYSLLSCCLLLVQGDLDTPVTRVRRRRSPGRI